MGMFDYVRCEVPLPDGYEGELQTKEFVAPYMLTHVITKDGRLMQSVLLRTEIVPKAERPYPDASDDSLCALIGSVRSITELRDANFHGVFSFGGVEEIGRGTGRMVWATGQSDLQRTRLCGKIHGRTIDRNQAGF